MFGFLFLSSDWDGLRFDSSCLICLIVASGLAGEAFISFWSIVHRLLFLNFAQAGPTHL